MRKLLTILSILTSASLLVGCGSDTNKEETSQVPTSTSPMTSAQPTTEVEVPPSEDEAKVLTAEYIGQMLDEPATPNYAFTLSELANEFTFTYTYNDEFSYSSTYLYDEEGVYQGTYIVAEALGDCSFDPTISKILDVEFAPSDNGKLRSDIFQMEGFEDKQYSYARFNLIANPYLPDTDAVSDALNDMLEAATTYHFTTGLEGPSYKCTVYSEEPIYIYIDNIDTLVNYRGPEDIADFDTKDNCLKVIPKKRGKGTIVITYKDGSSCSIALEIYI